MSECWINTLYDNYDQTLLRSDKQKNLITRETILEVLGRTEDNIKEGVTIKEVLPFFFLKSTSSSYASMTYFTTSYTNTTRRCPTSTTAPSTASRAGTTSRP